ncbi:TolC family protein [Pigmentiphaga sp. H8]|uniref:TolC family protein n=1 Tax=unclassified Pigmentiphaga TaxID=2626614 RepID=UPI000F59B3FA|nr:TolC family protein [Pigmentiphaga sp. H8]AZG10025.1 TolC family protein [Pigmentiphaga sp. H8]
MPFFYFPQSPPFRPGLRWALVLAVAALAGCASVPAPDLQADVPAQWSNAAPGAPAPAEWWKAFADPQLDGLVEQALAGNLTIAEAHARLQAARKLHDAADAPYLPNLGFRTRDAVAADASSSYFQAGFDATWEFGLFGRSEGAERQARASVDAAAATLQGARVSVAAEVVRAWRELRSAQARQQLLKEAVTLQERQVQLISLRERTRLASRVDVERTQAALEQARASLADPGLAVRQSALKLAVLLGRHEPDPAWLRMPAPVASPPALAAITSTPADMLRTRPDIQMAQARVLDAAGALGIARADLYPRLGIGGSLTVASNFANNFNRRNTPTYTQTIFSLGPLIDIPLFDWGQRQAAAHARGDELDAALLAYRQAVLEGLSEAESALIELDQYRQRREAEERALRAIGRAADHADRLTASKLSSEFDNADLASRRIQAQLALSATTLAEDLAFISLHKAVGGAPAWRGEEPSSTAAASAQ